MEKYSGLGPDDLIDPKKEWIGVDLDGTLAQYDEWRGVDHIGDPVRPDDGSPSMIDRIKDWLSRGITVKIFTARVAQPKGKELQHVKDVINEWCEKHIGQELEITNIKDGFMRVLFDDRAIQVEENTGKLME